MKIKIAKKIDLDALNRGIDTICCSNTSIDHYLIMNQETMEELAYICKVTRSSDEAHYGSYMGYPIAVCNKLKYGDVEIR